MTINLSATAEFSLKHLVVYMTDDEGATENIDRFLGLLIGSVKQSCSEQVQN